MFQKVLEASMGKDESETALPAGWEHLKAKAKARGARVSLVPDAPAPAEEPPKARRKARQAVEALDADEVMAREEQLMLREREAAVEASSEELAIRQALRKTAAGMGMASLRMTNAMNFVAAEVEIRMLDRDKIKDVPLTQLGAVLRAGAQLQEKTARVRKRMMTTTRVWACSSTLSPWRTTGLPMTPAALVGAPSCI